MLPIKVIRGIKDHKSWYEKFITKENPNFTMLVGKQSDHTKSIDHINKEDLLNIGSKFILENSEGLWYCAWSIGRRGGEGFDIRKIHDIDRFLKHDYYYWEFVRDSWNHGHFYRIETHRYRYGECASSIKEFESYWFYKIPTNEIPREYLPALSDIKYKLTGKWDLTDDEEDSLIERVLNGEEGTHPCKWSHDMGHANLLREIKLRGVLNELY